MATSTYRHGLVMVAALFASGMANAVPVSGQGTWETTLQARDLNGDGVTDAFYDTALDVTWLRNANLNGQTRWADAMSWADNLVVAGYGGWRLPGIVDTGAADCQFGMSGTDCGYNVQTATGGAVYSELAYLWYQELGNKALYDTAGNPNQPGWGFSNTGNFQNWMPRTEWLGRDSVANPGYGWTFVNSNGLQVIDPHPMDVLAAMAVHSGDIAAPVPEPEHYAMLILGLCIVGIAIRRKGEPPKRG